MLYLAKLFARNPPESELNYRLAAASYLAELCSPRAEHLPLEPPYQQMGGSYVDLRR